MGMKILMSFLEMKFLEGYRSQVLGALYGVTVLLQASGLLDKYWDMAEAIKGTVVALMPMTMAAKITKATAAAQDAKTAIDTKIP